MYDTQVVSACLLHAAYQLPFGFPRSKDNQPGIVRHFCDDSIIEAMQFLFPSIAIVALSVTTQMAGERDTCLTGGPVSRLNE